MTDRELKTNDLVSTPFGRGRFICWLNSGQLAKVALSVTADQLPGDTLTSNVRNLPAADVRPV